MGKENGNKETTGCNQSHNTYGLMEVSRQTIIEASGEVRNRGFSLNPQQAGQEGGQSSKMRGVWRVEAGLPARPYLLEKNLKDMAGHLIHSLPLAFSPKEVPTVGPELPDSRGGNFHTSLAVCILNSAWGRCFQNHSHCS